MKDHPLPWTCSQVSTVTGGTVIPVAILIFDLENKPVLQLPADKIELASFIVDNLNRHQPKYTQEIITAEQETP